MPATLGPGIRPDATTRWDRHPDSRGNRVTVPPMRIVEASEDLTAHLGEELDSLCSLLPVRWGPLDVLLRQVALAEGRPVGQVTVLRNELGTEMRALLTENGVGCGNVSECADLVVRSSFRNRGVGKELLDSIVRAAGSEGMRLFAVVTSDVSEARRTFLSAGWTEFDLPHGGSLMLGPVPTSAPLV